MSAVTNIVDETAKLDAVGMVAVVSGRDRNGENWQEISEVTSFSATGATIRLPRECITGRVISLDLPLPAFLRAYDHDKEFYQVWGLVQNCHVSGAEGDCASYVGIAFIGRSAPVGYKSDPCRSYRICGVNDDGLWKVEPMKASYKSRKEMRFWQSFELYLAQVDSERRTITGAKAVAENISKGGAAVVSDLEVNVGDRVKFISEEFDFSGLAVVCERQSAKKDLTRLHLKFVETQFPVEKLSRSTAAR
ncbi:MAG: PilZ domain-containing protein [Pyrinomonadaceae bacterium]|nr:PilZ domain-containing protein [Pyrinomonadaceae bacterium]